jgi:hypothetical protein
MQPVVSCCADDAILATFVLVIVSKIDGQFELKKKSLTYLQMCRRIVVELLNNIFNLLLCGLGSSVGIATGYVLDGLGFEYGWG